MPMFDVCLEVTCWQWVTLEADSWEAAHDEAPQYLNESDCQNYECSVNNVEELTEEEAATRR